MSDRMAELNYSIPTMLPRFRDGSNHGKRGRIVRYRGEERSVEEWAARLGLNVATVTWRLRKGWDIAEAFERPHRGCEVLHTVNGEQVTIREAARRSGINEKTLRGRMRKGVTLERAVKMRTARTGADYRSRFVAAESEIARLKARIAELEGGNG